MALLARVIFILFLFCFSFDFLDGNSNDLDYNFVLKRHIVRKPFTGKYLIGKAWRKIKSSKRMRKSRAYTGSNRVMDQYFTLLLSGDVELNPGPANYTRSTKSNTREDIPDFADILIRLEKKIDDGQENVLKNQAQILSRLTSIEIEIETFKVDLDNLKKKQTDLEQRLDSIDETVGMNCDNGKDLKFLMDQQEQYSRKSSVRIRGVPEQNGEDIEALTVDTMMKEIGINIQQNEIDIVHRVGRRQENKPRPILVKFLSHKTKEKVMRAKKRATNIKINEDLAPGIKRLFDEVSTNRRFLNIESVWTIDGRIKFRFVNNSTTFEIRSYADYHNLFNGRQ